MFAYFVSLPNSFPDLGTTDMPARLDIHPKRMFRKVPCDFWHRFDVVGSSLLLTTSVTFLLAIEVGSGEEYGWGSAVVIIGFVSSAVSLILLIWYERRLSTLYDAKQNIREPVLPRSLFEDRPVNFILLLVGSLLNVTHCLC